MWITRNLLQAHRSASPGNTGETLFAKRSHDAGAELAIGHAAVNSQALNARDGAELLACDPLRPQRAQMIATVAAFTLSF